MRLLVQNYAFCVALRYAEGQINFRLYNSENKGRGSFFALKMLSCKSTAVRNPFLSLKKLTAVYISSAAVPISQIAAAIVVISVKCPAGLVTPSK